MKIVAQLILLFLGLSANAQDINLPLSAEMTIEKSGVYNKNDEIKNVFLINNYSGKGSHGSGFLIKGGYILTNWHVVSGAEPEQIKLRTLEGFVKDIKKIVVDSIKDLALLIPYANLKGGFEFESEDSIKVGNQIYSWGFPFQYSTVLLTVGYISGYQARVPDKSKPNNIVKHIVFNGAFNPGNSGGPMIDLSGKVVGVVQSRAIPLSDDAISALQALSLNTSGFTYNHTDAAGKKEQLSEAQVISLILNSYQNIAQVMIGEGVAVAEVREFLHNNQIQGF